MLKKNDYTKRKKECFKSNIIKCPMCNKLGRMENLNDTYIKVIHEEKPFCLSTIITKSCDVPKIFFKNII